MANDDVTVRISAQIEDLQQGLNQANSSLKSFVDQAKSGSKDAASATQEHTNAISKLHTTLQGLESPIRGIRNNLGELAEAFAAAFAVEQIGEFYAKVSEAGEQVDLLSKRLGISVEQLSELSLAANLANIGTDQMAQGMGRLEVNMAKAAAGSHEQVAAFKAIGVSVTDNEGKLKTLDQILPEIADAFQRTADGPNKMAAAVAIGGRAFGQFIPLLDTGAAGLEEMKKKAEETGTVLTTTMADGMTESADNLKILDAANKGLGITLYEAVKPALDFLVVGLTDLVEGINNALKVGGSWHDALILLAAAFDIVVVSIEVAINTTQKIAEAMKISFTEIIQIIGILGTNIALVFSGQWTKAVENSRVGLEKITSDWEAYSKRILALQGDLAKELSKGLGPNEQEQKDKPGGADKPNVGEIDPNAAKRALAAADAAKAAALEEVKIEEDKNKTLLALSQETTDEYAATARELADKRYAIEVDAQQKKIALAGKDKEETQKAQNELAILEVKHRAELQKIDDVALVQKQQMEKQATQNFIQENNTRLQDEIEHTNQLLKMGAISANEAYSEERQLTANVYQENLARLDAEIATLKEGTKAYQEAMQQRAKLTEKFNKDTVKIQDQQVQEQMKKWQDLSKGLISSWSTTTASLLKGTATWRDAEGQVLDSLVDGFVHMGEKMIQSWVQTMITRLFISKATNAADKQDTAATTAPQAAMGAYKAIVGIPYVGPILAPIAAGVAYAGVMAFAEQGMVVDKDRMVYAHKDEMVLPAALSTGIQGMISGGKGGSGGGDAHLHYSPNINAPGSADLKSMLARDSGALRKWVQMGLRDGSLRLPQGG